MFLQTAQSESVLLPWQRGHSGLTKSAQDTAESKQSESNFKQMLEAHRKSCVTDRMKD